MLVLGIISGRTATNNVNILPYC